MILIVQLITSCSIGSCIDSPVMYTVMVGLAFTCEGGHFSTFAAAVAKIFGIQTSGIIVAIDAILLALRSATSASNGAPCAMPAIGPIL